MAGRETFLAAVARARIIEMAVAAWLMSRGWRVLPVYDYTGLKEDKAPKLQAADIAEALVMPDLFVARQGAAHFVEVKWKQHADWTRITRRLETGISLRLWNHYQRVQQETGLAVWILFVHDDESEIRGATLDRLAPMMRRYDGPKMGRDGMAFFPWNEIPRVAPLDVLAIRNGDAP